MTSVRSGRPAGTASAGRATTQQAWLPATALVLCDVQDHHHHDLPHSPRAILKRQVARLAERGYTGMFASELEFYLFDESYEAVAAKHYKDARTAGQYIEDYHILQTTREEPVMRAIRPLSSG